MGRTAAPPPRPGRMGLEGTVRGETAGSGPSPRYSSPPRGAYSMPDGGAPGAGQAGGVGGDEGAGNQSPYGPELQVVGGLRLPRVEADEVTCRSCGRAGVAVSDADGKVRIVQSIQKDN